MHFIPCGRKELLQRKQRDKNKNQHQINGLEHPTIVYPRYKIGKFFGKSIMNAQYSKFWQESL